MLDDKFRIWVEKLPNNKIYLFIYDMKITKPGKFSDCNIFYIHNF